MKNIVLKISGKTLSLHPKPPEGSEDDTVEFITEGTMAINGSETSICYEETQLSGVSGFKTTLLISPGKVRLQRSGEELDRESVMEFEEGRRFSGTYGTPYGAIPMEVLTSRLTGPEHCGNGTDRLRIEYVISLKGLLEARKELTIEVREKRN